MAKLTDFRDYYYLRGDHVVTIGKGYLQYPIGTDLIEGYNKPDSPIAKIRHNDDHNWANIGLRDSWLTLVDRPDEGTFVIRSGDSMTGDLRMWEEARILNTFGVPSKPSYSFLEDPHTGFFRSKLHSVALVLGGERNSINVIEAERFGDGNFDTNIYMEGDVWIDEITFTRRDGLRLDGEYAYFTGEKGLRLTQGGFPTRPELERAIIRYNNFSDNFEVGYDKSYFSTTTEKSKWGILSLQKGESSWMLRSGDSIYGDLQLLNDARVLLSDGQVTRPSLAFDTDNGTGIYHNGNGISLVVRGDERPSDAITIHKTGNLLRDNDIYLNGDVYTNEITFEDLRLDGDYAYFTGDKGLRIPRGHNNSRVADTGVIRYNTSNDSFEFFGNVWLQASGKQDFDTWVNRKGDSIYGDLRFIENARIVAEGGSAISPSITFRGNENTGIYSPSNDTIDFMTGSTINETPALRIERTGINDYDKRIIVNGDLIVHGKETILNTETVTIEDNIITLNKNGLNVGSTGIEVEGDGEIQSYILYNFSSNKWKFDNSLLGEVLNPIDDLDATNKVYVDTEIQNAKQYLEDLIDEERERAIAEEQRIESRLDDEITRSKNKEEEIINVIHIENQRIDLELLNIKSGLEDNRLKLDSQYNNLVNLIEQTEHSIINTVIVHVEEINNNIRDLEIDVNDRIAVLDNKHESLNTLLDTKITEVYDAITVGHNALYNEISSIILKDVLLEQRVMMLESSDTNSNNGDANIHLFKDRPDTININGNSISITDSNAHDGLVLKSGNTQRVLTMYSSDDIARLIVSNDRICTSNKDMFVNTDNDGTGGFKVFHQDYHPVADMLTNPVTISLTGDVTGTVTTRFDTDIEINVSANGINTWDNIGDKPLGEGFYYSTNGNVIVKQPLRKIVVIEESDSLLDTQNNLTVRGIGFIIQSDKLWEYKSDTWNLIDFNELESVIVHCPISGNLYYVVGSVVELISKNISEANLVYTDDLEDRVHVYEIILQGNDIFETNIYNIFNNITDPRRVSIEILSLDSDINSVTNGLWVENKNVVFAINKNNGDIRVINSSSDDLDLYITIGLK